MSEDLLQTNLKEAQTEIVRQSHQEFDEPAQKDTHSDDDEEVQIQRELAAEKQQLDQQQEQIQKFYNQEQLNDMKMLFGMKENEI